MRIQRGTSGRRTYGEPRGLEAPVVALVPKLLEEILKTVFK